MVGVLVYLLTAPPRFATTIPSSRLLVGAGRISYALYLFHMPLQYWIATRQLGWSLGTRIVVGVSVALAVLSYYIVERPCLWLKLRLRVPGPSPKREAVALEEEDRVKPPAQKKAA